MSENSCIGCKYLYTKGVGYSNWTHLDDDVYCAKNRNPNLPSAEPYDWNRVNDNWPKTNTSRCEWYSAGEMVRLDVDGYDGPADYINDEEVIAAICEHSGRGRNG